MGLLAGLGSLRDLWHGIIPQPVLQRCCRDKTTEDLETTPKPGCRRGFVRTGLDREREKTGSGGFTEWFVVWWQRGLPKSGVVGQCTEEPSRKGPSIQCLQEASTCALHVVVCWTWLWAQAQLITDLVSQMEIFHSYKKKWDCVLTRETSGIRFPTLPWRWNPLAEHPAQAFLQPWAVSLGFCIFLKNLFIA